MSALAYAAALVAAAAGETLPQDTDQTPSPVEAPAPTTAVDSPVTEPDAAVADQAATPTEIPLDDIVVTARAASPADPLAAINVQAYEAIQAVDDAIVAPLARGYDKVPGPLRSGLRNFLRNLDEPVSFINYLLQLKPGRALKSLARFAVNSTIGVGGLIDVAKNKPFNLSYKPNGFANTLACYGIGNGPYFFLPLVGPITLRDLTGLLLDRAAVPAAAGAPFDKPAYAIPSATIDSLNDRIEIDAQLKKIREESADSYVASRELYLAQRRAEVAAICPKKGDPPVDPALPPRVGKGVD